MNSRMSQTTISANSRLEKAQVNGALQWLIVGAWSILPFAAVMIAPENSMRAYFWTVVGVLGFLCFVSYAVWFGLTEALLIGLVFITNSALSDPDYLPRVSFLGGNFFFSDFYIVLACCSILVIGTRRKGELLGGYRSHFIALTSVVLLSLCVGLNRGAEVHYVLRELHPLIYYPLTIFLTVCALENPGALWRILVVTTDIVILSCAATLWQLLLISRFQFMTYASPVFGLSQGETLDAQSIRPPSQWLFLVFLLAAFAAYPLWKKHRILVTGVIALDSLCIFLGYSRTIFLAIAGGLVAFALMRKRAFVPFVWSMVKTTVIVFMILVVIRSAAKEVAPGYWEAFEERIIGSFETNLVDSDRPFVFGSRIYEITMAIDHIKQHPFLGLGAGAAYREILPFEYSQTEVSENPEDGRHFMHNTYLYVWMKYGLWGALAAGWIVWHFLRRTWIFARWPGSEALVPRGILVAFIGLAIANLVAPGFIASPATPTLVGLMAGLVEAGYSRYRLRETRALTSEHGPSPLKGMTNVDPRVAS